MTKSKTKISNIKFENIIKILLNFGFKKTKEDYSLKIMNDDESNNIRVIINNINNIQKYCNSNNLDNIDTEYIEFVDKNYYKINDKQVKHIDFDDLDFRVSYQLEESLNKSNKLIDDMLKKWSTFNKIFRYIKRFEFVHDLFPFKIHCSIVKMSKNNGGKFSTYENITDSKVFNSNETYEIELELDNDKIDKTIDEKSLFNNLQKVIKYILIGIQNSHYPICNSQKSSIKSEYLKLIKNDDNYKRDISFKDFIGPSSNTLQKINIIQDDNLNVANIRKNYIVTDKADGLRKLLFINNTGYIYLIPMTMDIEFTGCIT